MIYAFNFRTVITRQLARNKRWPIRIAWIYALCYPAKLIHDEFVAIIDSYKSEMKWNGQRIRLQRALQLRFGAGILVENQNANTWALIGYTSDDSRNPIGIPLAEFNNPVGYVAGTTTFTNNGFIVKVPGVLGVDNNELQAVVNLYKGQSNYSIEII